VQVEVELQEDEERREGRPATITSQASRAKLSHQLSPQASEHTRGRPQVGSQSAAPEEKASSNKLGQDSRGQLAIQEQAGKMGNSKKESWSQAGESATMAQVKQQRQLQRALELAQKYNYSPAKLAASKLGSKLGVGQQANCASAEQFAAQQQAAKWPKGDEQRATGECWASFGSISAKEVRKRIF